MVSTVETPRLEGDYLAQRRQRNLWRLGGLGLLALGAMLAGCAFGAVSISPYDWLRLLSQQFSPVEPPPADLLTKEMVLWNLRLPRVVCALLVGGGLSLAGAAMQGLFRNPLADPALIGVSSGAALGAALGILLAGTLSGILLVQGIGSSLVIMTFSFVGGLIAVTIVQAIGRHGARTSVATMLLAGIAINALCSALTGFILFLADDNQLRDITFWMLGSLGASNWTWAAGMAVAVGLSLVWLCRQAGVFNAFLLGEAEAGHLGYEVESFKRKTVMLTALIVGLAVSFTGVIGFVGLVVPHLIRLAYGSDHRLLLPASALLGGTILVLADTICRNLGPAELPIGIVTAVLGAPFFLYLMRRQRWLSA
ncbi:MAG: iron ABC transporter permease [Verrucomicrobiota bacterium]